MQYMQLPLYPWIMFIRKFQMPCLQKKKDISIRTVLEKTSLIDNKAKILDHLT